MLFWVSKQRMMKRSLANSYLAALTKFGFVEKEIANT